MDQSSAPSLTPASVVQVNTGASVDCYWCKKVLSLCDGVRTVEEVARRTHLPLGIGLKLMHKALDRRWVSLVVAESDGTEQAEEEQVLQELLWLELSGRLRQVAGLESEQLLRTVAACAGQPEGMVSPTALPQLSQALGLLLPEACRSAVQEHFEALERKYLFPLQVA